MNPIFITMIILSQFVNKTSKVLIKHEVWILCSLERILRKVTLLLMLQSYSKSIKILSYHQRISLQCNFLPSVFVITIPYVICVSPMRATCCAYLILFYLILLIMTVWGNSYDPQNSISPYDFYFSLWRPKVPLSTLFWSILILCCSFRATGHFLSRKNQKANSGRIIFPFTFLGNRLRGQQFRMWN
jgi:hypothetical protein